MSDTADVKSVELLKGKYIDCSGFQELHAKLSEEGYTVFPWQDSPGTFYMDQVHPNDELIVISSGEIVFSVGEERFVMETGDALVLPANTQHSAANEARVPACYFICTRT